MAAARIKGVLSPVVTPFKRDLSPDTGRFIAHCKWLLSQDCGLAVFGTNSEANSMSADERMELLDKVVAAGVPTDRMMPGTGACSINEAAKVSAHATKKGVSGVLMLPPFYYKGVPEEGLFRFFSEVVQRVGDIRHEIRRARSRCECERKQNCQQRAHDQASGFSDLTGTSGSTSVTSVACSPAIASPSMTVTGAGVATVEVSCAAAVTTTACDGWPERIDSKPAKVSVSPWMRWARAPAPSPPLKGCWGGCRARVPHSPKGGRAVCHPSFHPDRQEVVYANTSAAARPCPPPVPEMNAALPSRRPMRPLPDRYVRA